MFQFWGDFGAHFGARDLTLLKKSGQHFWATFSGRKFPPKSYAQKLRPKTPPSSGSKSILGAREGGEGEREVKGEGREGKGKRKGKREEDGEEERDRIWIICWLVDHLRPFRTLLALWSHSLLQIKTLPSVDSWSIRCKYQFWYILEGQNILGTFGFGACRLKLTKIWGRKKWTENIRGIWLRLLIHRGWVLYPPLGAAGPGQGIFSRPFVRLC